MKAPCGQEDCDCGHTIGKLVKALKPFAEVYGRSSRLIHESRGMSSVPLSHRVVLLSEQSDGSFGYLSIRTFRDAREAIDEAQP